MFFGLSNSPAMFQAFMNNILSDFIDKGWCVVYMDNILLFSRDWAEHQECTERLMHWIREHNLYFKPKKCEFDITEVIFLGMVIQPGDIAMDPMKLAGIAEWEPPRTVKGVHAFLGFGNFCQKFIGKYAQLTRPLNDLTKKAQKFKWTTACQIAFDLLKKKFLSELVLLMPDMDKPFIIEADASKWAMGAVLRQQGTDASSTALDDKLMETGISVPTSATPGVLSPDSPPNLKLSRNDSLPLHIELTNNAPSRESTPLNAVNPPAGREAPSEGHKDKDKDKDKDVENQTLSNDDNAPLIMSLRPPTPIPIPMTQLVDHVSALCVDWNAISPEIAHSTCVRDASKLSLGILLETALTSEGLAALCAEGLI
uniref:Reverse transcriptase domain-containing protein n=1 Tax=Moniliophthora roreri TaxID=221103 RepID=A0A0W0GFC2_MONRR